MSSPVIVADGPAGARPSLKLNALSNFAGMAATVAVGFFLTPAMLGYLGERRFGIWTLVSSVMGYFSILNFGVGSAVFRYVPLFHGQGNRERVSAVISTSLAYFIGVGVVMVLATQLMSHPIARFFGGGPEVAGLLRIIGLATALSLPAVVLNVSTAGYENFGASNLVGSLTTFLRGALLFACIWAGYGLAAMGWVTLFVSFTSLVGNSIVFKRACRDVRLSLRAVNWPDLRLLLSLGSLLVVTGVANSLATESPKQIVAKTISLEALGLFGIPLLLISYYRMLIITLAKVFSPRFSYLSGRGADDEIRRLFLQGSRYMAILAGAVAVSMWVVGPAFLLLWTGKAAILKTAPALAIMVSGTLVFLSFRLGADLLFGLGFQGKVALLELIEAIAIVGLTIPLSLKWGIEGAAVGFALPSVFVRGWLQTRFVCDALKAGFFRSYSECILRSWLVTAVVLLVAQLLGMTQAAKGWISLVSVSSLLLLIYALCVFFVVLEADEKQRLKVEARRLFGWAARPRPA